MRKRTCVLMMTLCLLLTACGDKTGNGEGKASDATVMRDLYHNMTGGSMEAAVSCTQGDRLWESTLRCEYVPGGETTVEVLMPENIAGVKAILNGTTIELEYEDICLNAGTLSEEDLSPMACLPQLMSALRDGWLLEENKEEWNGVPCLRITVDQSGVHDGKIISTIWLREDDGLPLRGEIGVDGENILTAEFTSFTFYDTINNQK